MNDLSHETQWLIGWFGRKKGFAPQKTLDPAINYFEAGWIDSMGVMDLIMEAEEHFGVRFNEKNFQDRRFVSIQGLAQIIREVSGKK